MDDAGGKLRNLEVHTEGGIWTENFFLKGTIFNRNLKVFKYTEGEILIINNTYFFPWYWYFFFDGT